MLYIKDNSGIYQPAPKECILSTARRLSGCQFRRGATINSPLAAKEAIGLKLAGLESELFACLFLDSTHQVLASLVTDESQLVSGIEVAEENQASFFASSAEFVGSSLKNSPRA